MPKSSTNVPTCEYPRSIRINQHSQQSTEQNRPVRDCVLKKNRDDGYIVHGHCFNCCNNQLMKTLIKYCVNHVLFTNYHTNPKKADNNHKSFN